MSEEQMVGQLPKYQVVKNAWNKIHKRLVFDRRISAGERPKGILMGVILIVFLLSLLNENISTRELGIVMQPYKESLILFGLLVAVVPFSAWFFGGYTFRLALLIAILLLFFVIPTPKILIDHYNSTRLIDRPFLSMFLCLPFCILFGTGLAGVEKWAANRAASMKVIVPAGLLLVLLFFPSEKVMKPLPDAIMAGKDDYLLYEDIRNHLPHSAQILIPNLPGYYYDRGLDGGVWLEFNFKFPPNHYAAPLFTL